MAILTNILDLSLAVGVDAEWLVLLLDASVKGLAVLVLAGVVTLLMRKVSAAERQLVWVAALAGLLVLPVVSAALPDWQVLPSWRQATPPAALGPGPQAAVPQLPRPQPPPALETHEAPGPGHTLAAPVVHDAPPPAMLVQPQETPAAAPAPAAVPPAVTIEAWVLAIWALGAAVCLAPMVLGRLSLWRLRRGARPLTDGPWPALLRQTSEQLGVGCRVALLGSDRCAMPMVWGVLRVRLLLPGEAANWSAERRRIVLLHELAHVKRWDCLVKIVTQLACAVYWFNPLVWLAAKRIGSEGERACDDLVLTAGSRPADYAEHLVEISSGLQAGRLAVHSSIAMVRPAKLEGRVRAILSPTRNRRALRRTVILIAAVLAIGITIPLACMQCQQITETGPVGSTGGGDEREAVWRAALPAGNVDVVLPPVPPLAWRDMPGASYSPGPGALVIGMERSVMALREGSSAWRARIPSNVKFYWDVKSAICPGPSGVVLAVQWTESTQEYQVETREITLCAFSEADGTLLASTTYEPPETVTPQVLAAVSDGGECVAFLGGHWSTGESLRGMVGMKVEGVLRFGLNGNRIEVVTDDTYGVVGWGYVDSHTDYAGDSLIVARPAAEDKWDIKVVRFGQEARTEEIQIARSAVNLRVGARHVPTRDLLLLRHWVREEGAVIALHLGSGQEAWRTGPLPTGTELQFDGVFRFGGPLTEEVLFMRTHSARAGALLYRLDLDSGDVAGYPELDFLFEDLRNGPEDHLSGVTPVGESLYFVRGRFNYGDGLRVQRAITDLFVMPVAGGEPQPMGTFTKEATNLGGGGELLPAARGYWVILGYGVAYRQWGSSDAPEIITMGQILPGLLEQAGVLFITVNDIGVSAPVAQAQYEIAGEVIADDDVVARVEELASEWGVRAVVLWYVAKRTLPGEASVLAQLGELGGRRDFDVEWYRPVSRGGSDVLVGPDGGNYGRSGLAEGMSRESALDVLEALGYAPVPVQDYPHDGGGGICVYVLRRGEPIREAMAVEWGPSPDGEVLMKWARVQSDEPGESVPLDRLHEALSVALASTTGDRTDAAGAGAEPSDVQRELRAYYDAGDGPPWQHAVDTMLSADEAAPSEAAAYLCELLAQLLADELAGVVPGHTVHVLGSPVANIAQGLRVRIAAALGEQGGNDAVLPVCEWYLTHEAIPSLQVKIMNTLAEMDTDAANEMIVSQIRQRHPNSVVMVQALEIATRRNLAIASDDLSPLCQYHRSNVREAARKLAERLRHPEPADFDPVLAMEDEGIQDMMARLATLYGDLLPVDAPLVALEVGQYPWHQRDPIVRGWLLEETDTTYTIMTLACTTTRFTKEQMTDPAATPAPIVLADEVERVAELRAAGDPEGYLSTMGFSGPRGRGGAGLYEITLGHWLYSRQEYELAAKVLLPVLSIFYSDENLIDLAKQEFGVVWGYRMLVAFVGQRDYDEALRCAGLLTERFDGTQFSDLARQLQAELPKRHDDFEALTLPTYAEWDQLRGSLTREQQIQFLCERFRLLNCFQWGQPGAVDITSKQFREPCGITENAAWGLDLGETDVINPFSVLTGRWGWEWHDAPPDVETLALTVDDIPLLATYLADDWHILAIGFPRDFMGHRDLKTQRSYLMGIINDLAGQEICSSPQDDWSTEAGKQAAIARIVAWAQQRQGTARADILLAAMERALTERERWRTVASQADELCQLGDRRVIPLLRQFLHREPVNEYDLEDVLLFCRRIDAAAFLEDVRAMLAHDDLDVRIRAGLIYLDAGEVATAQEVLSEALSEVHYQNTLDQTMVAAMRALLAEGSEASRQAVARLFTGDRLAGFSFHRTTVLKETIAAGMIEPYQYMRRMLGNRTNRVGESGYASGVWVADVWAKEIITLVAREDPDVQQIGRETEGDRERRVRLLLEWIDGKIDAIESAESDADADAH